MTLEDKLIAALASAIAAEAKAETLKEILLSEEQKSRYDELFKVNLMNKTNKVVEVLQLRSEQMKTIFP